MNKLMNYSQILRAEAPEGVDPGESAAPVSTPDWAALATEVDEVDPGLLTDMDVDGDGAAESPVETPAAVPPSPPSTVPTPEAPATPPVPAASPATPQSEVPPAVEPPGPTPETPAPVAPAATETPAPTAEEIQKTRESFKGQLEKQYALSEEDADAFITDPGKIVPKALADLHLNVTEAVMYGLMQMMPRMVEQVITTRETTSKAEQAFFEKWGKLNTAEGRKTVQQIGSSWRALNPGATTDDFIKNVGAAAMVALQLPIEGYTDTVPPASQHRPPPPPNSPGGAAPLPAKPRSQNAFTVMAEEFLEDD